MPKYTFHRITSGGVPIATTHYECDSDEAALAHAMENAGRCAIEVWRDATKIGHIDGGIMGISAARLGLSIPDCDPHETGTAEA
ncbi:MAG TPA: hypothetical protein VMU22_14775 [Rhizomicrobium sp.]|nr:hypothetical protein [Rhizomicrobium sp.]